jgi:hypothetical protein
VFHFPAVGRFPRLAADANPARVADRGEDRSTVADRRIATVAAATVTDAFRRLFMVGPTDHGQGLRGGLVVGDFPQTGPTVSLGLAHFTEDVGVTGDASLEPPSTLSANLALSGPGVFGQVLVSGAWFVDDATVLTIDGQINGHRVVLEVPSG